MKVSLIITTYNWPEALHLVLQSAKFQSRLPDEVIIADDGSTTNTAELIMQHASDFPVPLIHAWQPDDGFRAARSRNNGVAHSCGDYLIFVDGDTILHSDFVADHIALSVNNTFTVGSRVLLTKSTTESYLEQGKCTFSLLRTEADNKLNALHFLSLSSLYVRHEREPLTKLIFRVRSCNMGVWRSDYEAVNGFNHNFQGWGREDSEFALRLFNRGLSLRRLKFSAIQYHLFHPENDRTDLLENDERLQAAIVSGMDYCEHGYNTLITHD